MGPKVKARFAIGFKFKRILDGKVDPNQIYGKLALQDLRGVEAAYEFFNKKKE
jgi:hypothetical protein